MNSLIADCLDLLSGQSYFQSYLQLTKEQWVLPGSSIDLSPVENIYLLGLGKSAPGQVYHFFQEWNRHSTHQIQNDHCLTLTKEERLDFGPIGKVLKGNHPYPGDLSLRASQEVMDWGMSIGDRDMVIVLISGGTSALLCWPRAGLDLNNLAREMKEHMNNGMSIMELNRWRQSWDQLKNGGLLPFLKGKLIVNLMTNDIPSGQFEMVGSGPTINPEDERVKSFCLYDTNIFSLELKKRGHDINWYQMPSETKGSQAIARVKELCLGPSAGIFGLSGEFPFILSGHQGRGGRASHFLCTLAWELGIDWFEKNNGILCSIPSDGDDGPSGGHGGRIDYNIIKKGYEYLEEAILQNDTLTWLENMGAQNSAFNSSFNIMDLHFIWKDRK